MDFSNPHFAEPRWLYLALLGPLAVFWLHRYAAWARRRQLALFGDPALLAAGLRSHSPARRALKNLLLLAAVAGMGVALARPQWGETTENSQALGEDVLFILDCSRSMLTADVRPNRLERARYSILDFVQRHGRGRVGLVAFAGEAFLQCPLTFDYDAFREALMAVDERTIPVPGTDIGRALTEGYQAMDKGTQRKIMVLVTDGEDLEQSGVKVARELGLKGVHVFTIGVGTPAGGRIEAANERGERDFVRDPGGKIVESRLDEGTLRAIAEATQGVYRPLGAVGEGLNDIRWLIESGAGFSDAERVRKTGVERFHFPLAAVLLLLCVESLVGTRRNPRQSES